MKGVCDRAGNRGNSTSQSRGKGRQAADSPFSCGGRDHLGLLVGDGQVLQRILERLLLAILLLITFFLFSRRRALVFVVRWLVLEVQLGINV